MTLLSLCMIVKNEQQNLPRCLNSVKDYVDEIIIIDTGSEDDTVNIALSYGAKVGHFTWINDFSAARNYAISQASGTWILMLDADEELIIENPNFQQQLKTNSDIVAYSIAYIEQNHQSLYTNSYRNCLFRHIPEHQYIQPYHEYLYYESSTPWQISIMNDFKIIHYGFTQEIMQQKIINRSIPMLEEIRQKSGLNLRLLSTLTGMYIDTNQHDLAEECMREILEMLMPNLITGDRPSEFIFVPNILNMLGISSLQNEDYETVRLICQRGLEWCPNYPPLNYLAGATIRNLGFPLGAMAYFKYCLELYQQENYDKSEPFEVNYMTTYPAYDLGCIYLEQNQLSLALKAFEMALDFDANFTAAQDQINMIQQHLSL